MEFRRTILAGCLVLMLGGSGVCETTDEPAGGDPPDRAAAAAINAFAFDLYAALDELQSGNLAFSPASISTALAMTYAGARGDTARQMETVLHFPSREEGVHAAMGRLCRELVSPTEGSRVSLANALWLQQDDHFLEPFLALVARDYGAGVESADFAHATEQARKRINAWVAEATQGKIEDLLQPGDLTPATLLVLTNAIHFKGTWKYVFDEDQTREAPFHLAGGDTVGVETMHLAKARLRLVEGDGFRALELPYAGEATSMVLLSPAAVDGLAELERRLSPELLDGLFEGAVEREVDLVALPRFKVTSRFDLAERLAAMGMASAFGATADFSGITGTRGVWIDRVIHQALVEIDEQGTEAAAATAVTMKRGALPPALEFRADHPFLFLIRDRASGTILFVGRITDPRE